MKLKRKLLLIMIMINILLIKNLAQANLASKNDIANFVKKTDFDDKLKNLNKKDAENELN